MNSNASQRTKIIGNILDIAVFNKIKRETPTHIQEKIDIFNSSTGTQTTQLRKFININSGDYDCYMPAVSKQAKNYPAK